MPATSEPRTLEEMQARIREIRARQEAAVRRHEARERGTAALAPAPAARPTIEPAPEQSTTPALTPAEIIASIAAERGVTAKEIVGPSLKKHLVAARFVAVAAVASAHPRLSLTQIGRIFGGRDHTTILSALRRAGAHAEVGEGEALACPTDLGRSPGARSPEEILQEVATTYRTTVRHLRGHRHTTGLSAARRVAIVAIRAAHPGLSGSAIALVVNRDPVVVRTVLRNHDQRRQVAEQARAAA